MVTIVCRPTVAGATPQIPLGTVTPHVIEEDGSSPLAIASPVGRGPCPGVAQLTTHDVRISEAPAVVTHCAPAIGRMVDLNSALVPIVWTNQSHVVDGVA